MQRGSEGARPPVSTAVRGWCAAGGAVLVGVGETVLSTLLSVLATAVWRPPTYMAASSALKVLVTSCSVVTVSEWMVAAPVRPTGLRVTCSAGCWPVLIRILPRKR